MFWRFGGYANISTIDTILEKPDFTVEDLLDESDLIQEIKQQNSKLIEYLRQDSVLEKLLDYVVAPKLEPVASDGNNEEQDESKGKGLLRPFSRPRASSSQSETDPDEELEKKRNRYAFVAAEVLSSDTWSIYEALMENRPLIRHFWTFLKRPTPLDPLQASYFTKVNESLFDKKTEEMTTLLRELPEAVSDLLRHVECPMVMDLLLKIIALDRTEGGQGIVEWLYSQDVIPTLLSCLSPENNWVVQTAAGDFIKAIITISANASQNDQQCIGPNELTRQLVSKPCVEQLIKYMLGGGNALTVGVGIVIEVIRKNNSDYDPDVGSEAISAPSSRDPIYLGTLLRLFGQNVPDFVHLIMNAPAQKRRIDSTFGGKIEPLGFDRFKTCELMAELLHCSNMGLLNEPGSEDVISARDAERQRLRAEGRLSPNRGEEASQLDDMSLRAQSSPEENRKLEITNISDDDGFEEVEPSREMSEDTSHEFVKAEEEIAPAAPSAPLVDKDDDDFVDEPLSSPRLQVSDSKASEQHFEDPDMMVAPLSPTKRQATESEAEPAVKDEPIAQSSEATKEETTGDETVLPATPEPPAVDVPAPLETKVEEARLETQKLSLEESAAKQEAPADATESSETPAAKAPEAPEVPEAEVKPLEITKATSPQQSATEDVAPVVDLDVPMPAPLFSPKPSAEAQLPDLEKPLPPVPEALAAVEEAAEAGKTKEATEVKPSDAPTQASLIDESIDITASAETGEAPDVPPRPEQQDVQPVVGDYLKMQFVEYHVVPTILSFFFSYPWNNFLHNVVYDIVQQVFNGPMDRSYNPHLAVSLFEAADVTVAIINGQLASDESQAKTKTRMGYMGHLTLIAEEVVKFTERHPPELLSETVLEKVMDQNWINYVEGALAETRERDNAILGGVRPEVALGNRAGMSSNGLSSAGISSLGPSFNSGQGGSNALAEAGLNGGMEQDSNNNNGIGPFAISAGTLMSGFGSSSDEEDDDADDNDDDVHNEFRAYTDPLNGSSSSSLDPPSMPPPPPPPLNAPPSRARLQLAARLAMHQKNASNESAGDEDGSVGSNDSPERIRNPFADDDDDDELDSDDEDGDLHHGTGAAGSINSAWGASARGSWWRGMVRRRQNDRFEGDESDSDKEDNGDEDDEEFGDFAMPEAEPAPGTDPNDRVLLKPLAVHPGGAGQGKTGFSGLWPFGAKDAQDNSTAGSPDAPKPLDVITLDEKDSSATNEPAVEAAAKDEAATLPAAPDAPTKEEPEKIQAAVEAKRRTSIEDPDEDEVVVHKPLGV
ncbi:SIT4 phosphatase-associated protein-domain-containing protein [Plectosphaerella plurivora]|uniref:SIT4 phosphatase-associated protein-domain-containing protein n=1 Tax=Plectosphaerella plurivora TaxID=936078 RepID=A0A9P9AFY6_9PEZI|nr:SIT4 phosphatase-associated protein-domain-containing protein [Plectosphaerella plurivora]